ncbi:MAG: HEAT repeat domain-containing protein, partial [Planctomycetes bacterium]|nr:HEAT repeat domain-containing protein [Planctomycetota bacterium]
MSGSRKSLGAAFLAAAAGVVALLAYRSLSGGRDEDDSWESARPAGDLPSPGTGTSDRGRTKSYGPKFRRPPSSPSEHAVLDLVRQAARALAGGDASGVEAAFADLEARGPAAVPTLVHILLHSRDEKERITAARALAALGAKDAVPAIVHVLRNSPSDEERFHLVEVLGDLASRESAGALVELLADPALSPDSLLRETARAALVKVGGEGTVDALLSLLASRNPGAAESAASALAELGAARAVPFLADVLASAERPEVRMAA